MMSASLMQPRSLDGEDFQLDRRGAARAGSDADEAVQPAVALGAGLETRRGAHVVERGIDRLAGGKPADHLGRTMTVTEVAHVDERAVVGLERIARIELGDAVGTEQLPVGAARHHAAREPLAAEAPAGDRDDAPTAMRRVAELLRRGEGDLSLEQRFESQALSAA